MCSVRLLVDLQLAIELDDVKAVSEILLKKSELLNHTHKSTIVESILLKATRAYYDDEIGESLLDFLESVDFKDIPNLEKHLQITIIQGQIEFTRLLLKKGAALEGPAWNGKLPGTFVLEKNKGLRKYMLQLLFEYGLNASACNEYGQNYLHVFLKNFAKQQDYELIDIPEILINSGVSVNNVDKFEMIPLQYAINLQSIKLISHLIEKGADVNMKSSTTKISPLHSAACHDGVEIVELLLSRGAEINAKTSVTQDCWTPLHHACFYNRDKVISLLLQKGADISAENAKKMTPLSLLDPKKDNYFKCLIVIIKELSELILKKQPSSENDRDFIQVNPNTQVIFEKCMTELSQIVNTMR